MKIKLKIKKQKLFENITNITEIIWKQHSFAFQM